MSLSSDIKEKAFSLGFDLCGIAPARRLSEYEQSFSKWCMEGQNDKMNWLCRDIETRINPFKLLPDALSVIVTGMDYYTDNIQIHNDVPVVSRYAFGMDYHKVVTGKLNILLEFIKSSSPGAEGKTFCDSGPIAEKLWAVEAGLGRQGKNSLLINEKKGSFFFLGVILVNISLQYDTPHDDEKCGDCTECLERCPTRAINGDYTVDARKCISNLTIENKNPIPTELAVLFGNRIYGCDLCQEVCPYNRNAKNHNHHEFDISEELKYLTKDEWLSMTEEKFERIFGNTPVSRAGFEKFRKNIDIILNKTDN
ncbi:MAG: tRNA epoxyqueuosine(34) reductase QueG [Bacteroidales bacterium]|nr:tRNA epoxyqueuosine(34) reductase QueG [Bacteroidales bacterium]